MLERMEFICGREEFEEALSIVKPAVLKSAYLPVLRNVWLKADGENLWIRGTDLSVSVETCVRARVQGRGETTVRADMISDFVKLAPGDEVRGVLDERTETLELECGWAKANFKGIPASEFPELPSFPEETVVTVDKSLFHSMVENVRFAAAEDSEKRPVLTCVMMSLASLGKDTVVTMAAADGFVLAKCEQQFPVGLTNSAQYNVPQRSLMCVRQAFAKQEADRVSIGAKMVESSERVFFKCGRASVVTEVLPGAYPDYRQIIPKRTGRSWLLELKALRAAVATASVMAKAGNLIVRLTADPESQVVVVSGGSAESGDSRIEISAEVSGEGMTVAFQEGYLVDVLSHLGSENVVISVDSPHSPVMFEPKDGALQLIHVVMPMHVTEVVAEAV